MTVTAEEWRDKAEARTLASRGDRKNFEALFTWIWSWTVRLAGGEDEALSGWIKVIRDPALWQKPLPYFAAIFKNAGIDTHRDERKHRRLLVATVLEVARVGAPQIDNAEARTLIQQVVATLPFDYKEIIDLYGKKHTKQHRVIPGGDEIRDLAIEIFGSKPLARKWLSEPNLATDNKAPIELLKTKEGLQRVRTLLQRIDYGVLT